MGGSGESGPGGEPLGGVRAVTTEERMSWGAWVFVVLICCAYLLITIWVLGLFR